MASAQTAPSATAFPNTSQALAFGWKFFTSNFWLVLACSVITGVTGALGGGSSGSSSDDSPTNLKEATQGLLEATGGLVLATIGILVGALFTLVLARRALDYWDEVNGRVAPRSFSDGLKQALDGAKPRVFPYLGWSILQYGLFFLLIIVGAAWAASASSGLAIVLWILVGLVFLVFMLITTFYDLAAADRPGNPLSRSAAVFKGHTGSVITTLVVYGLIQLVIALPIALIVKAVVSESFGDAYVGVIGGGVFGFVTSAIGLGLGVSMYRAAIPPAGMSAASASRR